MKYLLLTVFVLYVIFLSLFSSSEFPTYDKDNSYMPYLAERPLIEDGFYSLKIAWNIGTGKGVTYNFNQPTTGFQPLYVFLLSFFAFVVSSFGGDKIIFLRIVILLSGLTALLLTYSFYQFIVTLKKEIDRKTLFIIVSLLVLFNFKLFLNLFNGLETGIYLVLILASIIQSQKIIEGKKSTSQILLFGFVLGLTVLARNDFILIAFVIITLLCFSKTIKIKDTFLILLTMFLTVLPWLIFIYSVQGSLIPTSASVQTGLSDYELSYRIDQFFYSIFTSYIPFIHAGQTQSLIIFILTVIFAFYLIKYQKIFVKDFLITTVIKFWSTAIVIISIVYLIFASQPYFFFRYLSIHIAIAIPFLALLISNLFSNRSSKFQNIFLAIVIALFALNAGYYFHFANRESTLSLRPSFIYQNKLVEEKIGMAQSGISGYFFDNVVNLDGKVNAEALSAIKKNKLYDYIQNESITVLIEWKEWFDLLPPEKLHKYWQLSKTQIKDNKTLVLKKKSASDLISP